MLHSERFHFIWKIKNFSMLPHKTGEYLQSDFFSTPIFDGTEFCLLLYPRAKDSKSNEKYLSCFIHRNKTDVSPTTIGYTMTLESIDGSHNKSRTVPSGELVAGYGSTEFVELKIINENKNLYVPGDVLTIKVVVWAPKIETTSESGDNFKTKTSINQCISLTQFQVGKLSAICPITGIHKCLELKEEIHFSVESAIVAQPSFKLSFSLGNKTDSEHAQIEIVQTKPFLMKKNIFVKCKITVVSAQKEYEPSQTDTFSFDLNAESVWQFPKFIEITNLEVGKYIHLDDTLYLLCEFSFTFKGDPVYHTEIPSYVFEVAECAGATNLSNSISKLYSDNEFCDVTLQVDNETFLAHKVALCAQSPVFYAMFKKNGTKGKKRKRTTLKEKNTDVIEITDVDVDTMELMLDFLHSDILKENLSTEDICKLYSAADKYQISHLKQKCARLLLSGLSVAEVCKVLILADLHQDDFLMSCVHNFVKYHANEIFHSSQWDKFSNEHPVLSGRIMLKVWKST